MSQPKNNQPPEKENGDPIPGLKISQVKKPRKSDVIDLLNELDGILLTKNQQNLVRVAREKIKENFGVRE